MLHIVTGCMFAGKTSKLVNIYNLIQNSVVLDYDTESIIKTSITQGQLYTHDNISIPCTKLNDLPSLIDANTIKLQQDTILINEAQFFTGLKEFVQCALKNNKTVYIFGLDGDFKQNKFGEIIDLIPMCNTYTKLYATCECGAKASFSKRLSTLVDQYAPDDIYKPVCRNCL